MLALACSGSEAGEDPVDGGHSSGGTGEQQGPFVQCADIMGQCRCDNRAEEPPAEPPTCGVTDCCTQRTTPEGLVLCSCFSQAQLDAWGRTCEEHHEFAMISCAPGDTCELVDICPSE